jgi:hypothetical protein
MLSRIPVIMMLIGLTSCSASMERPRAAHDPSSDPELGVFMKTRVNPPFSKISFLLFHDGEGDGDLDPSALPASAGELAAAAEQLGKWPELPGQSPQSKLVFNEYAGSLRSDSLALITALGSGQRDGAVKAFESLRKKCDSCHHFFRYDEASGPEDGESR